MTKDRKTEYDRSTQTLWVDYTDLSGQALIAAQDLKPYVEILRDSTKGPDPVGTVNFVFKDRNTAEYNKDSLAFSRIGTWLKEAGVRRPLDGDTPEFQTREDFGI